MVSRKIRSRNGFANYRALLLGAVVFLVVAPLAAGQSTSSALSTGSAATRGKRQLTLFLTPLHAQFMNHADDRVRGMSANPFTPNEQALVVVANGTEKRNGPFPGDDVLYTFDVHSSATLGKSVGSALFTCYYNFAKHATCDAYFELKGGTLLASGQIVFGSTHFLLSVTGGTRSYLGAHGQVSAAPAPHQAKKAQRLAFVLLGP